MPSPLWQEGWLPICFQQFFSKKSAKPTQMFYQKTVRD